MTLTILIAVVFFASGTLCMVYLGAKLAAYGWLKGKWRFEQDHPEATGKEQTNGQV